MSGIPSQKTKVNNIHAFNKQIHFDSYFDQVPCISYREVTTMEEIVVIAAIRKSTSATDVISNNWVVF